MPAKFRVRITRTAERDVENIWSFIAQDSPEEASRFIDRLEDQIATWSGFPKDVPSFLKPKFSVRDTDICFTVATEACFALGGKRFTFCG